MSNIIRKILDLQRPTYNKFRGVQLNLSRTATLSTEESGRCGEVAVMEKSRLPPQLKKKCVCGHVRKRSPLLLRSMVSYCTDKTQHRRSLHKSADDGSQRLLGRPHQKRRPLRHSSPANRIIRAWKWSRWSLCPSPWHGCIRSHFLETKTVLATAEDQQPLTYRALS